MLAETAVQSHADRIRDDGYTVIEGAASAELVARLIEANRDPIELLGRERGKRMVWEATDAKARMKQ